MNLISRLKKEEDERFRVYDDATGKEFREGDILVGNLTIGVGINIMTIDQEESDFLLEHRIKIALQGAWRAFGYNLFHSWPERKQDVFLDMIFNMGITRFLKFEKMIVAAKANDWARVKVEMLDSDWARGRLANRAKELAELII